MEGLSAPLPSCEPCKGSQTIQGHRQHGGPVRADGAKLPTATLSARTRGLPASMWEVAQKVAPWAAATALLTGAGVVALRAHQGNQRARQQAVQALESQVAHLEQQVASEQGKQAGSVFVLNQCRLKLAEAKQQLRQADLQVARLCDQVCGLVQQLSAAEAAAATAQAAAKASAAKAARASAAAAAAKNAKRRALSAKHAAATQAKAKVAAAEQRAEAAQQRAVAAEAEAAAASAAKVAAHQAGATAITNMQSTLDEMAQQLEEAVARAATADSAAASNAAAAVEVAGQLAEALQQAAAEREALQQEVGALQAQVMQLGADLLQQHAATAAAQGRADATATSAAANEAALADVQQRLDAATAALQSSNEEVAELSARLQQRQEALLAAQAVGEEAVREAEAAGARAVAAERQLQESSAEMQDTQEALRAQLSEAEAAAADAKAQAAATSAQAAAKVAAAEEHASNLQQQLQAVHHTLSVAEGAKVEAMRRATKLEGDLAWEKQEVREMEMRLDSVLAAAADSEQRARAWAKDADAALEAANAAAATAQEEAAALRRELQALQASAAAPGGGVVRQEASAAAAPRQPQHSEGGEVEAPGLSSGSSATRKRNQRRRKAASKGSTAAAPSAAAAAAPINEEHAIAPAATAVAAPSSIAPVVAADGSSAAGAAVMGVIVGGSVGQQQEPQAMAPAVPHLDKIAADMAGSSVPLRLPQMAALVQAMVGSGHRATAEDAAIMVLQLLNGHMAVAAPLMDQGQEAEGAQQLRAALCQLLQEVAAVIAPVHPATADLLLRQAADLAPGGELPAASTQLAAWVAAQLGWFEKAAALLHTHFVATRPVQWESVDQCVAIARKVEHLREQQAVVVTAVQLLADHPAHDMEHQDNLKKTEETWGEVRLLRVSYPHSQLLLLLDALLCVQLQQAADVAEVVRSLPTCSPQLTAALAAAGGLMHDIVGQSPSFWLAWLGWQCGMVAQGSNPRFRSRQLTAAANLFTTAPAANVGGGVAAAAAAAATAAHSEYVTLLGALYPTAGVLEAAQVGLGQLLEEEEAAHALMAALEGSADARAVEVVPLHPYWAAHVYLAQGEAFYRQDWYVLAMRSFALAAGLSKAARPAFAAVATCRIATILYECKFYSAMRQVLSEAQGMWPFALDADTEALRQHLVQAPAADAAPQTLKEFGFAQMGGKGPLALALHPDKPQGNCVDATAKTFSEEALPLHPGWVARWESRLLKANVKTSRGHLFSLFFAQ